MKNIVIKFILLFSILSLLFQQNNLAGPPFLTDDPEPVPFKHWEYYISTMSTFQSSMRSGTLPHFEVNYGLIRNMQVHLLLPVNYLSMPHHGFDFGYADTEFGIKYCFIDETESHPQIGTFPIVEIPTVRNREFSNGKVKVFIPVWIQKSWNHLTSYGGAGYLINPAVDSKNQTFLGWELQYDFSKVLTLGEELYFQSAGAAGSKSTVAFNLGGFINFSENFHFLFSFGRNVSGDQFYSSYLGLLYTL